MHNDRSNNSDGGGGDNGRGNHDLPPIRKAGPAVLPKPKHIKIQAGRGKLCLAHIYVLGIEKSNTMYLVS